MNESDMNINNLVNKLDKLTLQQKVNFRPNTLNYRGKSASSSKKFLAKSPANRALWANMTRYRYTTNEGNIKSNAAIKVAEIAKNYDSLYEMLENRRAKNNNTNRNIYGNNNNTRRRKNKTRRIKNIIRQRLTRLYGP